MATWSPSSHTYLLADLSLKMTRDGKIFCSSWTLLIQFLARRIAEDTPGVLYHLIEEHHTNFVLFCPDQSVIPKMHFLVHTPLIMMKYGEILCCLHDTCVYTIHVSNMEEDDPVFARLGEIYIISSTDIFFKVVIQTVVCYSAHFHAFVSTSSLPKLYKLFRFTDLLYPFPLHPRTVNSLTSRGQYAIVPKHALCAL